MPTFARKIYAKPKGAIRLAVVNPRSQEWLPGHTAGLNNRCVFWMSEQPGHISNVGGPGAFV